MQLSSIPSRLSAEELSVVLNISEQTVKALARKGELPCFKEKGKTYFDLNKVIAHFKSLEGAAA